MPDALIFTAVGFAIGVAVVVPFLRHETAATRRCAAWEERQRIVRAIQTMAARRVAEKTRSGFATAVTLEGVARRIDCDDLPEGDVHG